MYKPVLIVDDDVEMCKLVATDLERRGIEAVWATSFLDAVGLLETSSFDAVLTDLRMPGGMGGLELCQFLARQKSDTPAIVMTAFGSLETAIESIRAGAYDFVTKPVDLDLLAISVQRALKHKRLSEQLKVLRKEQVLSTAFPEMIGNSEPLKKMFDRLDRLADSDASVLICGESGTGKELVAKALHRQGRRASGPFVALNCASLPDTLLESELFGHKKGAFTDAKNERQGLFLAASGGTLFLDEIGEMSLALQPKVLRALEQRSVRPVGGTSEIPIDVRIIAATNRDLETAVEQGTFREDLFFRINVIQLQVPPLRSRGADILLIGQHYIDYFSAKTGKMVTGISKAAARFLLDYSWPGNVRELRNAVEHAVALTRFDKIKIEDIPDKIVKYESSSLISLSDDPLLLLSLEEFEKRYIQHVLKVVGNNRTLAARTLGIDRKTIYRKMQEFDRQQADPADRPVDPEQ